MYSPCSACVMVPQEVNDAAKNDQIETVPPEVMKGLGEMGAFGMQVRRFDKLINCKSNTVYRPQLN